MASNMTRRQNSGREMLDRQPTSRHQSSISTLPKRSFNFSKLSHSSLHAAPTQTLFHNAPLYHSFLLYTVVNGFGFMVSLLSGGSHVHLDLLGTGAFAIASLAPPLLLMPKLQSNFRIMLSSAAVSLWSVKLALFLFFRAMAVRTDARLDDTLKTLSGTFLFWFISFLWGIICSLPHTIGSSSSHPGHPITTSLGLMIYALGFITETRSDYQKWIFKQSHSNTSFCNIGLWSVSQHPNFFGNLLLWMGILIINVPSFVETPVFSHSLKRSSFFNVMFSSLWSFRRIVVALLSPCFMYILFYGQASGSITNAVELAKLKYGGMANGLYETYTREVPLIFPHHMGSWLREALKL